jgi:uncharacterized protein YdhG (YjbR/CyaY superfamily)
MAAHEVDAYLASLDESQRTALEQLRATIREVLPDSEECLSYGSPAFKVDGKAVAGFAAFKHHLSYLPHSGDVLATLASDVDGYETSKGALKFEVDAPLPEALVSKLISARLAELGME